MGARSHIYWVSILTWLLSVALLPASFALAQDSPPPLEEMWRIIKQQQAEIDELKKQNALLKNQIEQVPKTMAAAPAPAPAPVPEVEDPSGTVMEIYGHTMLDMGYQFNQNDPDWYDVVRPTKLPVYDKQYGEDKNKIRIHNFFLLL